MKAKNLVKTKTTIKNDSEELKNGFDRGIDFHYANKILNEIPNRQYYLNKRLEYDGKKSFSVNNINITENDLYFYLKKNPVENSAKLFFRKGFVGKEIELFDPLDYKKEAKKTFLINYIKPNYNGSKVAIALTESGKEISEMVVYDLEKKKILCYPL